MRAVLPVWRTTPIAALHRESGIPPIVQLLETRRMRFAARLKALDEAHPLAKRTLQPKPPTIHRSIKLKYQLPREGFRTRLRRSDQLLPRSTRPLLLPHRFDEHATPLQTASKDESAEDFRISLRSIPYATLIVYSDGSLSPCVVSQTTPPMPTAPCLSDAAVAIRMSCTSYGARVSSGSS